MMRRRHDLYDDDLIKLDLTVRRLTAAEFAYGLEHDVPLKRKRYSDRARLLHRVYLARMAAIQDARIERRRRSNLRTRRAA